MEHRAKHPHCDPRVLHAPKSCSACDLYPERQELRVTWQIAFTGEEPKPLAEPSWASEGAVLPCPADLIRGKNHAVWAGNRPSPHTPREGFCCRCKQAIDGFRAPSRESNFTAGYYHIGGIWEKYANPGEKYVCDICMWADPRYIADYRKVPGA